MEGERILPSQAGGFYRGGRSPYRYKWESLRLRAGPFQRGRQRLGGVVPCSVCRPQCFPRVVCGLSMPVRYLSCEVVLLMLLLFCLVVFNSRPDG